MRRTHTSNRIRFGRETPNWVTRPTTTCGGKRGHTAGAGEERLAGQCRVVLLRLASNGSPPEKEKQLVRTKNFGSTSPVREGYQTCKKRRHDGRQTHIHVRHDGRQPQMYFQSMQKNISRY